MVTKQRKNKWLRRGVLAFLFTCLTLAFTFLGIVIWVNTANFQNLSTRLLEQVIEDQSGEEATVNALQVHFFKPGVTVHGLHLWNRATDQTILTVEKIGVPLNIWKMGIGKIEIKSPHIQLNMAPDGKLREFRNIKKSDGAPKPLKRLPFEQLMITDGKVRFSFPNGKAELMDLNLLPKKGNDTSLSGQINLEFKRFQDSATFQWDNITFGPDRFSLPNLDLQFRALQVSGPAKFALDSTFETDLNAEVKLVELNDLLVSPRAMNGIVKLKLDGKGDTANPTLNTNVDVKQFQIQLPGKNTPLVTYRVAGLTSNLIATKTGLDILPTHIDVGGGTATLTGRIIPVKPSTPDGKTTWHLEKANLNTQALSLAKTLRAAGVAPNPWVGAALDATVEVSGPLKPLDLSGNFNIAGHDIRVGDRPIEHEKVVYTLDLPSASVQGTMSLNKEHVLLNVTKVKTPRSSGSCVVDLGFKPEGPLDISFNLPSANLADFQPLGGAALAGRGKIKGRLWGPFTKVQLLASAAFSNFSATGIEYADYITTTIRSPDMKSITMEGTQATKGETRYAGDITLSFSPTFGLETDLVISKGRLQDVTAMFMDMEGITGIIEEGEIHLNGPFNDLNGYGDLDTRDVSLFGEVFDTGKMLGRMHQGTFTLAEMRFTRNNGSEGLELHGTVGRKWALNMNLNADLHLSTLNALKTKELPLKGHLTANLRLDNTLFAPYPQGKILLTKSSYDDQPTDDSLLTLHTKDDTTSISGNLFGEHVQINGNVNLFGTQNYVATATLKEFPLHLFYPLDDNESPLRAETSGFVQVDGTIGGTDEEFGLNAVLDKLELEWDKHHIQNTSPISYQQHAEGWHIQGFKLASQNNRKSNFQLQAVGDGANTKAEGKGEIDLDLLRLLVPGLERAEGRGKIRFSSIKTEKDTQTIARLILDAPLLRHSGFPGTLEDVQTSIMARHDGFVIERFKADLGGGQLYGTAIENEKLQSILNPKVHQTALGVIEAKNWVPSRFTLQGRAENSQIKWTDSLAPAVGNADIYFDGPTDSLLLSGQVEVVEMDFTDRINWEDWVIEVGDNLLVAAPPSDDEAMFSLNVGISADNTIRLSNNIVDASASVDLKIVGDTSRPGMLGWVRIDEGFVYLQDREFKVGRGDLKFTDPWSWDPDLDIDLITDLDSRRRRYRVHYRVIGLYSDWKTQTSSEPWLSQADINALLWFGITAEELEEMGELGTAVGQAAVDLIIQDFIQADYLGILGFQESLASELLPKVDLVTGANIRGEYSSDPRVKFAYTPRQRLKVEMELNLLRSDHYGQVNWAVTPSVSLSGWYATRSREGFRIPGNGALGVDLLWLHEFE